MLPVLLLVLLTVEVLQQNYQLPLPTIRQDKNQVLTQNALLQLTRNAGMQPVEFYRHLAPKHGKLQMNMYAHQFRQTSTAVIVVHPIQQRHSAT
jgi:hypothetical protein